MIAKAPDRLLDPEAEFPMPGAIRVQAVDVLSFASTWTHLWLSLSGGREARVRAEGIGSLVALLLFAVLVYCLLLTATLAGLWLCSAIAEFFNYPRFTLTGAVVLLLLPLAGTLQGMRVGMGLADFAIANGLPQPGFWDFWPWIVLTVFVCAFLIYLARLGLEVVCAKVTA